MDDALTLREVEVLTLVSAGNSNKTIAKRRVTEDAIKPSEKHIGQTWRQRPYPCLDTRRAPRHYRFVARKGS